MKHIEGRLVVGAPMSKVRFEEAHVICENCLTTAEGENISTDKRWRKVGVCYVCESITCVERVIR